MNPDLRDFLVVYAAIAGTVAFVVAVFRPAAKVTVNQTVESWEDYATEDDDEEPDKPEPWRDSLRDTDE